MGKKLVDLDYQELKEKMDQATKNNDHRKSLDYSVALISKPRYHIMQDNKWMLKQQIKKIDEIIATIHPKRNDRDMIISKLNQVKKLTLQQIEEIKEELKTFK